MSEWLLLVMTMVNGGTLYQAAGQFDDETSCIDAKIVEQEKATPINWLVTLCVKRDGLQKNLRLLKPAPSSVSMILRQPHSATGGEG